MENDDSVTDWILALKTQDSQAADRLYHRYLEQLKTLVRRRLNAASRRVSDEEDIAHAVLANALEGIAQGRFHKLNDRRRLRFRRQAGGNLLSWPPFDVAPLTSFTSQ